MIQVKDAGRVLQFEGVLLGTSSSHRRGSGRWVEFALYRTDGGSYVIARTGQTLLYHRPSCSVVARNGLERIPAEALSEGRVPCPECGPDVENGPGGGDGEVAPEAARYWAIVSDTAEGVLDSLYRFDDSGTKYLTIVARRLLEQAASVDPAIAGAYRTETIA